MEFYQQPDPWYVYPMRGVYIALAVFFVWLLFFRRRELVAFVEFWGAKAWRLCKRIWRRWGPLLSSKTFWGGLVMYISYKTQSSLPPEAHTFVVDVLFNVAMSFGLLLVAIGRVFAKIPLIAHIMGEHDPDGPLIGNGPQAELEGRTYDAEGFREFMRQERARPDAQVFGIHEATPDDNRTAFDPTPESVRDPLPSPKRKRAKAKKRKATTRRTPRATLAHA